MARPEITDDVIDTVVQDGEHFEQFAPYLRVAPQQVDGVLQTGVLGDRTVRDGSDEHVQQSPLPFRHRTDGGRFGRREESTIGSDSFVVVDVQDPADCSAETVLVGSLVHGRCAGIATEV